MANIELQCTQRRAQRLEQQARELFSCGLVSRARDVTRECAALYDTFDPAAAVRVRGHARASMAHWRATYYLRQGV